MKGSSNENDKFHTSPVSIEYIHSNNSNDIEKEGKKIIF